MDRNTASTKIKLGFTRFKDLYRHKGPPYHSGRNGDSSLLLEQTKHSVARLVRSALG